MCKQVSGNFNSDKNFNLIRMNQLLTFIFLTLSLSVFAQRNNTTCQNYSVKIIDNKSYWDTIIPGLKKKKIAVPDSNLTRITESLSAKYLVQINKEIRCALNVINERRQNVDEPVDTSIQIISTKIFQSDSRIKVCYVLAESKKLRIQIGVIGIFTDSGLITYTDGNALELKVKLIHIEKRKSTYFVYGEQKGNPDNPFGGKFKLTFAGDKRIVEYEYCEITE